VRDNEEDREAALITDAQILNHIQRQPRGTAGYKQLLRELSVRGHERRDLEDRLRAMVRRGELVEIGRDRYALPAKAQTDAGRDLVIGRLHMHRDGYGFVTPDSAALKERFGGDIFLPPDRMGLAMHGDHVQVEVTATSGAGRAEGRVLKLIGRAHTTVVGRFHHGPRYNFVTPMDDRLTREIVIPAGHEVPAASPAGEGTRHRVIGREAARRQATDLEGMVVDVEVTQWPTHTQPARGRVLEVLGDEEDFGVDVEIVIRKHHIPHLFPEEVLDQAQRIPVTVPRTELARRRDFRGLPIVTIDGETARDFDDAVLVRRLEGGHFELQVHIADVAQFVPEGTPLDDEARRRGTSVYFPDRAVPMLPLELSTDLCSLRPQVDRMVLSCVMELDAAAEIVRYEIQEGVIHSAARMTYTDVQLILDGDARARAVYAPLVEEFERMRDLAERLNRKRDRRGSIDFDLPEPVIEFDEHGLMRGITRSERKFAHRLIEEFMLAANECVAAYLEARGVASLYRIHEKPSPKRVYDFEMMAAGFGYSLGVGPLPVKRFGFKADRRQFQGSGRRPQPLELPEDVHVTPRMYQKLAQRIAGKPEERILSFLMLRSLKQARYSAENEGHFALAAPVYTHFTSPIRRYPDLVVHRILKALIREEEKMHGGEGITLVSGHRHRETPWSETPQDRHHGRRKSRHQKQIERQRAADRPGPIPESRLRDIAEESSFTERRADEAERELVEWKKLRYMRDRVGEDFDALIISTTKYGFFVELTDMFIEGLVPLHSLTWDRFTFRENTRQIIGEHSRHVFAIGDRVRVLLDRIDREARKLQFAVLRDEPEPPRRSGGSGRPSARKKARPAKARRRRS
jgi:ribonuclease R